MRPLTVLLGVSVALATVTVAAAGENLLVNPGFEEADAETGFPAGWEPVYWSNPHGTIEASDVAHTGERSVMLKGLPPEQITDAGRRNNHLVAQELGDLAGMRRLVLRAFLRAEGNGRAYCSIFTYDADGNRLQYESSRSYVGQADWTEIAWRFTTAPQTARMILYLRNGGEGAVWYDDMSLTTAEDVLDSGVAQVLVDPLIGGRVRSFTLADGGAERTVWTGVHPGGMAAEIVPSSVYPGLLRDAPYQATVLEPNRRVLLRHEVADPELAGLVIEKIYAMADGSATLDVTLRVTNTADGPRELALRAQQCLPPTGGMYTWPVPEGLRVYRHPEHVLKRSVWIENLAGGWIGHADPDGDAGTVMLFDGARVTRALLYFSYDLQTIEWYYKPATLAPGERWETGYRIAAIAGGAPVVAAEHDRALTLAPLTPAADEEYSLALHSLRSECAGEVRVTGTRADGERTTAEDRLEARALQPAELALPWGGMDIERIEILARSDDGEQAVLLSQATINDEPLHDLPEPPSDAQRYASTGFFPYGEYFRGHRNEAGTLEEFVEHNLRAYRRNYINTYILGEGYALGQFREAGVSWMADMARSFDIRLLPKGEFMRVFETVDGDRREVFPGNYTREQAVARIESGGFDLDLRKAFAEAYGDMVVAWDVSDEPGAEQIPNYMMIQSIFREIDPRLPVLTILNLSKTEFLPYMPIYYGDEYPIHNTGRKPSQVYEMVRFCATHTKAPVWVMLQAFGGRQDYSWYLPTGPEMRMMIYSVLAAGGKGITFHGSFSPPCWRFHHHYFYTSCDSWGAATPAWPAMREAGRQVTAIGPVMLETEVDLGEALNVRCEQLETEGGYAGPGVRLGVLRERGGDGRFVVAVNQDVDGPQSAALLADPEIIGEDAVLFDLFDLAEVGPGRQEHAIELAAGDARIFFCGSREAGEAVVDAVHSAHYRNEAPIYRIDASIAEANELRLPEADALARQAAEAYEADNGTLAHERVIAAQRAVAEAIAGDEAVGGTVAGLAEALELLTPVAHTFRDHFDVVVPPEDRDGAARYSVWQNTRDPRMQQYVDETAACFTDRLALERRLYAGEAALVAPDLADLVARARRLNAEAIPYVLSKSQEVD